MFETSGMIGKEEFKEIFWGFMPRYKKVLYIAAGILMLMLGTILLIQTRILLGCQEVVLGLYEIGVIFLMPHINTKRNLRRLEEYGATGASIIATSFTDDRIVVENRSLNEKGGLTYESLKRYYKTKRFIVLVTKSNQLTYIFRDQLDMIREMELFDFLHTKPTGIKKW